MNILKLNTLLVSALVFSVLSSCNEQWDTDNDSNSSPWSGMNGGMSGGSSSGLIDFDILSSFTVEVNTSALSESESIPTDESDVFFIHYIENNFSGKNITSIVFNDAGNASVTDAVSGDTILVEGGYVEVHAHSKGLTLSLSGSTSKGMLKVYSDKKFCLALNDVSITNPDGSAVNIQDGNCFVTLSGSNYLSDAAEASYSHPESEDMKAVLFAEDDLRFSGSGSLTVNALNNIGKACISSDDVVFIRPNTAFRLISGSSAGNGIKANEALVVKGGLLNIETSSKASKALSSNGNVQIDGGRITAITTGGVDTTDSSDPSGCAAIKCDSTLRITGGDLFLKSTGQGGKGISSDGPVYISGGNVFVITEGNVYGTSNSSMGPGPGMWGGGASSSDNSVSPKGIRCDDDIVISGGNVYVRTYGSNAEGIESKATLSFTGGNTAALAYDDGFNAKAINISGGKALAISSGDCDGMDSNGNITATGGVLIGVSSTLASEDGIDCENTFTISNATVIALCARGMGGNRFDGHYISTNVSGSAGDYVALCDGTTPLVTFRLPRTYSSGKLILSSPSLTSGTYSLVSGVTPKDGSLWMNYLSGCSSVEGGSSVSVTCK